MKKLILFTLLLLLTNCSKKTNNVITNDIDLFWKTYDLVRTEKDSTKQIKLIDSLYLKKGSKGLQEIVKVKNYKSEEFAYLINNYPKFWESLKNNTLKSKKLSEELNQGIDKLRDIYPKLKPAKIYFTIGAMRTNGTTKDSLVLIGSELAMADKNTNISEFKDERTQKWLKNFFGSNPINHIVLLNIHEYVHTQQNPIPNQLLYQCLYEGIAEFISVKALDTKSTTPAIELGKTNPKVLGKFEKEMFFNKTYEWLWSSAPNEFKTRDLGYYIGYEIAEQHYKNSSDKLKAIKELIEINYKNHKEVNQLIDKTKLFSKPIETLKIEQEKLRPFVTHITEFENESKNVDYKTKEITINFSESLNGYNTSVDYGELGEKTFPIIKKTYWSNDNKSWTMKVDLKAKTKYDFFITHNFRTEKGIPLKSYEIKFETK